MEKSSSHPHLPGNWGELEENGTWNGLLGLIQQDKADMAINYFTVTRERVKDFDYSPSYYREG